MAGASDAFETNIMKLIFNNDTIALIGDATGLVGSTADGSLYVSLHTADPEAGDQSTSEATYTGYSTSGRQAVARTTGGWSVSGDTVSNVAAITFSACTSGSESITHFGIGTAASGTGSLLFSGAATLSVSTGVEPKFDAGELDVTAS